VLGGGLEFFEFGAVSSNKRVPLPPVPRYRDPPLHTLMQSLIYHWSDPSNHRHRTQCGGELWRICGGVIPSRARELRCQPKPLGSAFLIPGSSLPYQRLTLRRTSSTNIPLTPVPRCCREWGRQRTCRPGSEVHRFNASPDPLRDGISPLSGRHFARLVPPTGYLS